MVKPRQTVLDFVRCAAITRKGSQCSFKVKGTMRLSFISKRGTSPIEESRLCGRHEKMKLIFRAPKEKWQLSDDLPGSY